MFFAGAGADRFTVYVNADPESPPQLGVFAGREIQNSVRTEWGTFSIVKATIALLRAAIRDDLSNERFVLVSDNAVPLAPFRATACALLAEPRSVINACDLTKHDRDARSTVNHDHLIRLPPDFPSWINGSVWRKSSQWWVLNRRHAAMVSTGALSMRARDEFAKKVRCAAAAARDARRGPGRALLLRGRALLRHGAGAARRGLRDDVLGGRDLRQLGGVRDGHPKTFASVGAFAREREKRPRVELLSCGGRLDPPTGSEVFEALETTTCADAGRFRKRRRAAGAPGPRGGDAEVREVSVRAQVRRRRKSRLHARVGERHRDVMRDYTRNALGTTYL